MSSSNGSASGIPGIGMMGPIGEILGAVGQGEQQHQKQQTKPGDSVGSPALENAPKLQFGGLLKPKAEDEEEEL